jgi:2-dehydropantoate 2-reductase
MNESDHNAPGPPMRLVILGAGQMGAIYGAAAHENGNDASFVDVDDAVVNAINTHGLRIDRRNGRSDVYRIKAEREPIANGGPADVVLVMVKGWATASAAARVAPAVDAHTIILTLQNGLGNEETLRNAFPTNEILIGVSVHTVITHAAGHYSHTGVRDTYLGPSSQTGMASATRVASLFARDDFPVHVLPEAGIRTEQWGKFVLNCASLPTMALTRLPTSAAADVEGLFEHMDDVTRETCEIGQAEGIDLDAEERVAFQHELFRTAGGRASMLGDVFARRRTEIDTINGAAIRFAEKHGLAAPLNRTLFKLVKGLEYSFEIEPP